MWNHWGFKGRKRSACFLVMINIYIDLYISCQGWFSNARVKGLGSKEFKGGVRALPDQRPSDRRLFSIEWMNISPGVRSGEHTASLSGGSSFRAAPPGMMGTYRLKVGRCTTSVSGTV